MSGQSHLTRNSPSESARQNLGPLDAQHLYHYRNVQHEPNDQQQQQQQQQYQQVPTFYQALDPNSGCQMSSDHSNYHHHLSSNSPECVTRVSIHRQTHEGERVSGRDSNESEFRSSPRVVRWSPVDRTITTPSDYQAPVEVICNSRDGRVSVTGEQAHTMTVDGDSLTLVILDCSPQPVHIQNDTRCDSGSATRSCDCASRCYCQTELIVRQHLVPYDDHTRLVGQHNQKQLAIEDTTSTTTTTREETIQETERRLRGQQHSQHEHYQQWMRERDQQNQYPQPTVQRYTTNQQNLHNSNLISNQQQQQQQQQQQSRQEDYRQQQEQQNINQSHKSNKQPQDQNQNQYQYSYSKTSSSSSYQPQYNFQPSNQHQQPFDQYQQLNNFDQQQAIDQLDELLIESDMAPDKGAARVRRSPASKGPDVQTRPGSSSQQQTPDYLQQDQSPRPNQPQTSNQNLQQQSSTRNTRLVKKWDWNQQQFIMTEVPDGPSPKPVPMTTTTSSTSAQSAPLQAPNAAPISGPSAPPGGNFVEQPTIAGSMSALTTARPTSGESANSSEGPGPQYDPSWLAYRVPDMDSVQSDPLYSDLMQELQRLEEGVKVPEPVVIEPETFQKPVFGQKITPEQIETNEYETVEFICRLIPIYDPSMKVEWTVNGKPLQESNRFTNEHEFGVVRLRIKRCEAEDSGVYQCKATNSLGEAVSTGSLRVHAKGNVQCETLHPAGLDKIRQLENPKPVDHVEEKPIEQAPKFLTHITDYVEKEEGESVHFECCLSPVDDPDLKTEWFFNGRPLVTGSRFHTIDDFGFIVLDIDWLFPRDTGEYVCRASNKYGTDITRTVLRVKPAKNIILDSQLDNPQVIDKLRQLEFPDVEQEVTVEEPDRPAHFVQHLKSEGNKSQFVEGDNVHFEARVGPATDGNLTVEWFHNDKPLISGHRFKPTFDFGHIQLDILYVYAEDSGIYKCVAKNAAGVDVSQCEIKVKGKPSLVYQSQLPKEMEDGVRKITEMEAMWNRPPDPEEEEAPAERIGPEFVLKPKPCTAFEGSCARFCCRIVGNPRPRLTWTVNGQTVVSGSRYKLTYDGMYHLIIPKCQLSDAGKVEVYARNLLGECFCTTELNVKRKVDDYRGVLKNSPNPWYDEQSLKVYQRQRSQDLTDDEDFSNFQSRVLFASQQQSHSPMANQVIGYMEPDTPDVNLLAHSYSPLLAPGDLHPVVVQQQHAVMAPAPSTIKRALDVKDDIKTPEKSFQLPDVTQQRQRQQRQQQYQHKQLEGDADTAAQDLSQTLDQQDQHQLDKQHVFGLDLPRYSAQSSQAGQADLREAHTGQSGQQQQQQQRSQHDEYQERLRQHQHQQQLLAQQRLQQQQQQHGHQQQQQHQQQSQQIQRKQQQQQQQVFDPRLPPPSPESVVHGKEVHSHTHKQTQKERRANQEIVREIIEKEIFEQEHRGVTKENMVRGSSLDRGSTPDSDQLFRNARNQQLYQQQQQSRQGRNVDCLRQVDEHGQTMVLVEEYMVPPEFTQKIQPCRAIDGDEARFECSFKGDPTPSITWYRESKLIKPSNLYNIITDLKECKSTLIIKRVALNANAVYTVKAENVAGSAKSSANLVVEPHPLASVSLGGVARKIDSMSFSGQSDTYFGGESTSWANSEEQLASSINDSSQSDSQASQKVIKSVRTRKLSGEQMAALIRASPEGIIAPTFLHTIHDVHTKLGELARIDARLIGTQPMDVKWIKDGERIRADRSHKMVLEGDLYTLLILECSQRDQGTYECIATNRIGEATCEAKLIIVDASSGGSKTPEPMNISHTHSTTMATASSSSATSSSMSASAQQQQFATGAQRTHYGVQKHQNSLVGQFTPAQTTITAQQVQVPKLIKHLENQQVVEGKSVTLRCQISSFPIAEVYWYKQGDKLIKPSKYFRIFKDNDETYCLKILETFAEDQGEYKCVARAANGRTQVETKATITVIPNSPR